MTTFSLMNSLSCYINDLNQLIEFNPERASEELKMLLHELIRMEKDVTQLLIKSDNEERDLIKQFERVN